jgi:hypothetical protein
MAITLNNTDINGVINFSGTNVGIGISTPGNKLNVVDSTNCIVESRSTNGFASFQATASGINASYMFFGNAGGEKGRITSYDGGELTFSNGTSATERMRISATGDLQVAGTITPSATNTHDLGTAALRWRNIYTQDLHLSNGIGDYTVIEGEEDLFLVNNKTGRSFKFALIEVDPTVVPPKSKGN